MSDANTAPTRHLFVVESHLEGPAKQLIASGFIRIGGPLLTPESILPGADKKMVGSLMICQAESIEEVRKAMESDIYYTSGVWDKEKLVILPFLPSKPL